MSWDKLVGMTLPNDWKVVALREREAGDTGGNFSVQFDVERGGIKAFMKAFDLAKLFRAARGDLPRLQKEIESINFEKALLEMCLEAGLTRVATPLEINKIEVAGVNADNPIEYIIFEKGEADLRKYHNYRDEIDHVANLVILRSVALGLSELHKLEIAHQDLKPSNVVLFEKEASKIVDLGRASHRPKPIWHDAAPFAGDPGYAPIEILYNRLHDDWFCRRMAGDLYMLGSLVAFMFTGVSLTSQVLVHTPPLFHPRVWTRDYDEIIPYLRDGLRKALTAQACFASGNGAKVASLIRELCDPDPELRGTPKLGMRPARYSMQRYISIFERMIREVKILGLSA